MTRNYVEANIVTLANKYSIVVQEYFQERVKVFLETVGKNLELIIIGFGMSLHHPEDKFMPIYWQSVQNAQFRNNISN